MGMISSSKSVIGSSKSVIDDNPSVLGNSSVIAGSGAVNLDFVFDVDTENAGTLSDEFQLPLVNFGTIDFTISHPDLINSPITITAWDDAATLLTFNTDGIKTGITCVANNESTISGWRFADGGDKLKLLRIQNWGAIEVTHSSMFMGCSNMTIVSAADAPLITATNLSSMFRNCTVLTDVLNISLWGFTSVTNLAELFRSCSAFVGSDVSNIVNTGSVAAWSGFLQNCSVFNKPLNSLDMSAATSINLFLRNAFLWDQDISGWNIGAVTNAAQFLEGTAFSQTNYDLLLNAWDGQAHNNTVTAHFGTAKFSTIARVSRDNLVGDSWTITDGGQTSFDISVKTDNSGDSATDEFQLPLVSSGTLDFVITGAALVGSPITITAYNDAATLLEFTSAGTHSVSMIPNLGTTISGWQFGNGGDKRKLLDVANAGDLDISQGPTFHGCSNLVWTATDAPIISGITLNSAFNGCTIFDGAIGNWDVSAVTNMNSMFNDAIAFNQDIGSWNVSAVTNMTDMFKNADAYNQSMNSWNVEAVLTMHGMFENNSGFNGNISSWVPTLCTNMSNMFNGATAFNQDIGSWDVSSVTTLSATFFSATSFNQDIDSWDVSSVVSLSSTFRSATVFNQPLNSWVLDSVNAFTDTFTSASAFNQPLSNWDASGVFNMGGMFNAATSFDQDLGDWDISSMTNAANFFNGVTLSTVNYSNLLIGWNANTHNDTVTFDGGNSQYSAGAAATARGELVSDSWTITDNGEA